MPGFLLLQKAMYFVNLGRSVGAPMSKPETPLDRPNKALGARLARWLWRHPMLVFLALTLPPVTYGWWHAFDALGAVVGKVLTSH